MILKCPLNNFFWMTPYLWSYSSHCAQIWRACSSDHPLCAYQVSCCSDHAFSIEQGSGLPSSMCFQLAVQYNFTPWYLRFSWSNWAEIWRRCPIKRPLDIKQSTSLSSSPFLNYPSVVRQESRKARISPSANCSLNWPITNVDFSKVSSFHHCTRRHWLRTNGWVYWQMLLHVCEEHWGEHPLQISAS